MDWEETDHARIDKWLAERKIRTTTLVTSEGSKITQSRRRWPVVFTFNTDGELIGVRGRIRAWWFLRGSGISC